jgi:drug/metabolite transporter (DMT)-like permease
VSRSLKAHLLLVLIALIWGATFVVIKDALKDATPLLFNAIRMALAFACLAAFYPRDFKRVTGTQLLTALPVGVFLFAGYAFQTTGLRLTTASKSAFITGLSVVLVPLFLFVLFKRKLSIWSVLGVAAAFCGLAMLALPAGQSWRDLAQVNRGDWLTLACAISFAFHIIWIGRATERISFQSVAIVQTGVAAALMFASVPVFEHAYLALTPRVVLALIVTAVFATAVAFTVQSWAQQFTPPTHTALIFSLEPVFAAGTSYLVLQERLGTRTATGCALILAGVLISELVPQLTAKGGKGE